MKFRNCPICGNKVEMVSNGISAFLVCGTCGTKSTMVHKGAGGETGMQIELDRIWSQRESDKIIKAMKTEIMKEFERAREEVDTAKAEFLMTEADWMKKCYKPDNVEESRIRIEEERWKKFVDDVLKLYDFGATSAKISEELNVKPSRVRSVISDIEFLRKIWNWQPPEYYREKKKGAAEPDREVRTTAARER